MKHGFALLPILALLVGAAAAADNAHALRDWQNGNREQALAEWRALADAGDATAQFNLATRYLQGDGLPQSRSSAIEWLRRAADGGSLRAMELLGSLLMSGNGFEPQYAEALKWLNTAAGAGSAVAKNNLAVFYLQGQGAPVDLVRAHHYAEDAAKAGVDTTAMLAEIERHMTAQQLEAVSARPVVPESPPQAPPPTQTATSGWLVHNASVIRHEDSGSEWQRQKRRNPPLQQFEPLFVDVRLANGAQVTRIFVGGFADRETARDFCALIKRDKTCLVTLNKEFR